MNKHTGLNSWRAPLLVFTFGSMLGAGVLGISGSQTEGDGKKTCQTEVALVWENEAELRLALAMEMYSQTLELGKCYEALVAAGNQRDSKEWTDFQFDMSIDFFQPIVDLSSDIALAVDFVLDRIESGELEGESANEMIKIADQHLEKISNQLSSLREVRGQYIIRARTLSGSKEESVLQALKWGEDVSEQLYARIQRVSSP